jgi:hypothetical protein
MLPEFQDVLATFLSPAVLAGALNRVSTVPQTHRTAWAPNDSIFLVVCTHDGPAPAPYNFPSDRHPEPERLASLLSSLLVQQPLYPLYVD